MRPRRRLAIGQVRVTCPRCGPTDLPGPDVLVIIYTAVGALRLFLTCPECGKGVTEPITPEIGDLLRRVGARIQTWHRPQPDPDAPKLGPSDLRRGLEMLHSPLRFDAAIEALE